MMKMRLVMVGILVMLICSCGKQKEKDAISSIRELGINYPDSALTLLESSITPDVLLSDELLAEWCLLNATLRDTLREKMDIDTALMRKAVEYYHKKKMVKEEVEARYYYGRVLANNNNISLSMSMFMKALEQVEILMDNNLAGYICSCVGDLYKLGYDYNNAVNYYNKAIQFYDQTNNLERKILAYCDLGNVYFLKGDSNKAFELILRAEKMNLELDNDYVTSIITNNLGNLYFDIEKYDLSESYIMKALSTNYDKLSNYYALIDLYISQKRYNKAYAYLDTVKSMTIDNEDKVVIYQYYYQLEKDLGNLDKALSYLEKSSEVVDSVFIQNQAKGILTVERRYQREQLLDQFKIERQILYNSILAISLFTVVLSLIWWVLYNRRRAMEKELQQELEKQEMLAQSRLKEFDVVRRSLLEKSILVRKMNLITNLPHKGNKEDEYYKSLRKVFTDPFFTDNDWVMLRETVDHSFPNYLNKLNELGIKDGDLDFCCLLRFRIPADKLLILLNLTKDGLKSKRYRIIKKLDLVNRNVKLEDFLDSL